MELFLYLCDDSFLRSPSVSLVRIQEVSPLDADPPSHVLLYFPVFFFFVFFFIIFFQLKRESKYKAKDEGPAASGALGLIALSSIQVEKKT